MEEIWKDIPGFSGLYQASSLGRVKRVGGMRRSRAGVLYPWPEKFLTPVCRKRDGYCMVRTCIDGTPGSHYVHRLVASAFFGAPPAGQEVCHGNGDRSDNRLCNLRYDTRKANQADRVRHGTDTRGAKASWAKLTESDVQELRILRGRISSRELAAQYAVSHAAIKAVFSGRNWRHV